MDRRLLTHRARAFVLLCGLCIAAALMISPSAEAATIGQVQNGEKPPMWLDKARAGMIRGPITVDGMGPTQGWQAYWKDFDARRRSGSSWAALTRPPLVA